MGNEACPFCKKLLNTEEDKMLGIHLKCSERAYTDGFKEDDEEK